MSQSPLSSEELTFQEWWKTADHGWSREEICAEHELAKESWNARDPEISSLKSRIAELEKRAGVFESILSIIANKLGHPGCVGFIDGPVSLRKQLQYIIEAVDSKIRTKDLLEEKLESLRKHPLEEYSASHEHHEEHHKIESSLREQLSLANEQVEKMRVAAKVFLLESEGEIHLGFEVINACRFLFQEALSSLPPLKTEDVKKEEM